jgi:pyruvate dehydrogenase E2 component (dihydrolipoamide acetyltransferase)
MLGITVETTIILEWLKNEGDPVKTGEALFVVEADKVTTEVESPATGTLAKILLPAGQKVPVLTVVAVITEPGEELPEKYVNISDEDNFYAENDIKSGERSDLTQDSSAQTASWSSGLNESIRIIPAARKLAIEKGLDITNVTATGPDGVILLHDVEMTASPARNVSTLAQRFAADKGVPLDELEGSGVRGRIMVDDVQRALEEEKAPALGKILPMGSKRQVIARRMSESAFTAPHIYFFSNVYLDPLLNFKQGILEECERHCGFRPSINDFFIKAAALNIVDFPIMNAIVREQEIHIQPEINISLAVALPDGLIVPAITNADKIGLEEIARQRLDLVKRAKLGRLTMNELERGTFTISSLAQYDITHFTAILNPPQSGILSVGKARDELYLEENKVKSRKVITIGLSADHRIIDGVIAAGFLQNLKHKLEKPMFTFLHV